MNKLFGIIGNPIGHSMSPLMHNDAFSNLGMKAHYHPFQVSEEKLAETIVAFRVLNISGFNVTIPHKVAIMNLLDEIDEEAKIIGAVNTVVNKDGKFIGFNTDGRGYLKSLLKVLVKPLNNCNVLVLGAGGAARGVITAIAKHGVGNVTITNRTIEKAVEIKENVTTYMNCQLNVVSLTEAEEFIGTYDIIINTTSIGMSPKVEEIPFPVGQIKKDVVYSDLIYNPLKTKWLAIAEQNGAIIHNGVGMFVEQGALAFEKWTGVQPDTNRMEEIVMRQLGGKTC